MSGVGTTGVKCVGWTALGERVAGARGSWHCE